MSNYNFLDLFAGAGGLSEGFIQAGFNPIAHVEADAAACATLKTRQIFHLLSSQGKLDIYADYLKGNISRKELWGLLPDNISQAVINEFISKETIKSIFKRIDDLCSGKSVDIIIGGPPCQAYSLIGRAQKDMKQDPRNLLYIEYVSFLKKYKPKYFVFENVSGLLSATDSDGNKYFEKMLKLFNEVGYAVEYKLLTASDYGIPQHRKRLIIVGKRGVQSKNFYPSLEKVESDITVWDILKDLPKLQAGTRSEKPLFFNNKNFFLEKLRIKSDLPITFHDSRPNTQQDLEIYRKVVHVWNTEKRRITYNELPANLKTHKSTTSFVDRFKVVAGDLKACHTVVAHISKDGHHYIHPDIEQNRSITPREAARLQTFPDDYFFESYSGKQSRTSAYKQIGNAVPVFLAYQIATKLIGK